MVHNLLDNRHAIEPGLLQKEARQQFPTIVAKSHLVKRIPNTPIPDHNTFVVIGVATSSPQELQLLDDIDDKHDSWSKRAQIAVFDFAQISSYEQLQGYAPGLDHIDQTPLVIVWKFGEKQSVATGLNQARGLLGKLGIL